MVDTERGDDVEDDTKATFTFRGVAKPIDLPDTPPVGGRELERRLVRTDTRTSHGVRHGPASEGPSLTPTVNRY